MKYVYPAVFTPEDGGYAVSFPDLPGCHTCGDSLAEAIEMAEDALALWLWDTEEEKQAIPPASPDLPHTPPQFTNYIKADTDAYKRLISKTVKKTLTIPAWLNEQAEKAHINFSGLLQKALKEHLQIPN